MKLNIRFSGFMAYLNGPIDDMGLPQLKNNIAGWYLSCRFEVSCSRKGHFLLGASTNTRNKLHSFISLGASKTLFVMPLYVE